MLLSIVLPCYTLSQFSKQEIFYKFFNSEFCQAQKRHFVLKQGEKILKKVFMKKDSCINEVGILHCINSIRNFLPPLSETENNRIPEQNIYETFQLIYIYKSRFHFCFHSNSCFEFDFNIRFRYHLMIYLVRENSIVFYSALHVLCIGTVKILNVNK